jgi:hypothetical protein
MGVGMFVQVINGKVTDAGAARAMGERWISDLGADASGWLGSTAGVTADGGVRGPGPFRVGGGGAAQQ